MSIAIAATLLLSPMLLFPFGAMFLFDAPGLLRSVTTWALFVAASGMPVLVLAAGVCVVIGVIAARRRWAIVGVGLLAVPAAAWIWLARPLRPSPPSVMTIGDDTDTPASRGRPIGKTVRSTGTVATP